MAEEEVTLEFLSAQMTTLIGYVQDLCGAADVLICISAGLKTPIQQSLTNWRTSGASGASRRSGWPR
jgi:hypothetical protein